jgi:signal transduction histidine kinase
MEALQRMTVALEALTDAQARFVRGGDGVAAIARTVDGVFALGEVERAFVVDGPQATRRVLVCRGYIAADVNALDAEIATVFAGKKASSDTVVPLYGAGDNVVGVLGMERPHERWRETLNPVLIALASFIEAIATRRRRNAVQVELDLRSAVAEAVARSKDNLEAVEQILAVICQHTGWDVGQAWAPSAGGDVLECMPVFYASSGGFEGLRKQSLELKFTPGMGLPGRAWERRVPLYVDLDTTTDSGPRLAALLESGLVAGVVVPVLAWGEVVALLEFGARARSDDLDERVRLITSIAGELGPVLERLRLARAHAQCVASLDGLEEGLALVSPRLPDGRLHPTYCNAAYLRLLGVKDMREAMEAFADDRLAKQNPFIYEMRKELAKGKPVHLEATFNKMDGGTNEVEVSMTPIRDASGAISSCAVVVREIGEIRRAQAERRHLEESLKRIETAAALGRIVAGVAHEVRNPLFGIGATVDALEARMRGADEYATYIRVLRGELSRMSTLMHELLEYGRPPQLSRTTCSIAEVVEDAIARCSRRANDLGVTLEHEGNDTTLSLDRGRVLQVLINLVDNAVHHSPAGKAVRVHHGADNGNVFLNIDDDGPGFPLEDLPRLFEPFFTKRSGGTGLGLSIVQRIVEQHGGAVAAENRPGGGARVAVCLPVEVTDGG